MKKVSQPYQSQHLIAKNLKYMAQLFFEGGESLHYIVLTSWYLGSVSMNFGYHFKLQLIKLDNIVIKFKREGMFQPNRTDTKLGMTYVTENKKGVKIGNLSISSGTPRPILKSMKKKCNVDTLG